MAQMKANDEMQKQLLSIFEQLEEAIITKEESTDSQATNQISYQNKKFKDIIRKMKGIDTEQMLD